MLVKGDPDQNREYDVPQLSPEDWERYSDNMEWISSFH